VNNDAYLRRIDRELRRVEREVFAELRPLLVTSIVIGTIYPLIIQQFTVRPSELVKEQPYIERNINATRDAYDIADAEIKDYPGSVSLPSKKVLEDNVGTLSNIRLLDPALVSATYNQLQQIRGYYSFNNRLDIDRYNIGGTDRGSVVAVAIISQTYRRLVAR
jgi:uncharacterized membrane protein (UPF0182 family)